MTARRRYRLAALGSVVVVGAFTAWLGAGTGGRGTTRAFDSLVIAVAALAAATACLHAARRGQYGFGRAWTVALRRAWRLLAAAALCWGAGQLIRFWLELAGGHRAPFPSPADVFLLAALPLAAAGVLSYPTAPVRALAQVRTVLDGLLIASSLLFASWAMVLGPTYRAGGGPVLARVTALAYPIGDMVILTIAFSVLARTKGRVVVQPVLVTAAILSIGIADSAFAYLIGKDAYATGAWLDIGWLAGWLLLAVAALRPAPAELLPGDDRDGPIPLSRLALPYVPPAAAFVAAAGVQATRGQLEPFLVFDGITIALFVVARQVIATIENQRLDQRLRSTVDRLFQREAELETALRREYAAADRLRAMSEMKDTFLRAVSHDLRTPLTAMHGVAVTLERTKLNLPRDQALDLIRMMIEKTRKMDRLLADLLDLNRMEEGILEPNRSLTDVRALVHRVVDEVDQLRGWPVEIDQAHPARDAGVGAGPRRRPRSRADRRGRRARRARRAGRDHLRALPPGPAGRRPGQRQAEQGGRDRALPGGALRPAPRRPRVGRRAPRRRRLLPRHAAGLRQARRAGRPAGAHRAQERGRPGRWHLAGTAGAPAAGGSQPGGGAGPEPLKDRPPSGSPDRLHWPEASSPAQPLLLQ